MAAHEQGQWLIVSDIDDTLTGDRDALNRLWAVLQPLRGAVRLVLNSSRPAASVDATIRRDFPAGFSPDAIITGLGTEIRIGSAFLPHWSRRFETWPRQDIVDLVLRFGHRPHPDEFQTRGKASFAVPDAEAVEILLAALSARGLPVRALYTGESDLDLIAPEAGKDKALLFIARHFKVPDGRVIAAGDSGNDLAMFEAADRAIAVGNARRELRHTAPRYKTYFARAAHAAGVLEGLQAFGVVPS